MKNKIYYHSSIIIVFALSCNSTTKKNENKTIQDNKIHTIEIDTIKPSTFKIPYNSYICSTVVNKFHKNSGVMISDYYETLDSLNIDLNNDKQLDKLLVLSPKNLESDTIVCPVDRTPKRLLAEIINNNGASNVRNVYLNLISDVGGVLSKYNSIYKTKDGFGILHEAGAKFSWSYKTEFSIVKNNIVLSKISKICSVQGKGKTSVVAMNILPEKINVVDTLNVDCNCDKIWEKLDKN